MKEMQRAERRRDLKRMKARVRRIHTHNRMAKSANHLKVCSCWMCGNPRRYGEVPIAERRVPAMDRWWSDLASGC